MVALPFQLFTLADMKRERRNILIGNSFPLSLIRREVDIKPESLGRLRETCRGSRIYSFWGHRNTIKAAKAFMGYDLTPASERPSIRINADGLPVLHGEVFDVCWILSPDYVPGFRPAVGEEVGEDKILNWQVLKIAWSAGG